jgi:hypothetical protein
MLEHEPLVRHQVAVPPERKGATHAADGHQQALHVLREWTADGDVGQPDPASRPEQGAKAGKRGALAIEYREYALHEDEVELLPSQVNLHDATMHQLDPALDSIIRRELDSRDDAVLSERNARDVTPTDRARYTDVAPRPAPTSSTRDVESIPIRSNSLDVSGSPPGCKESPRRNRAMDGRR